MRKLAVALALVALGLSAATIYARKGPRFAGLTGEQRDAVRQKVEDLKAQGASRQEIAEAVRKMLDGWGIKPPRRCPLTEERRAELREMVKRMREEGAPPADIRRAVAVKLRRWGIRPPRRHFPKLTEEQREAIRRKLEELKAQGASRQEARRAVVGMLKEWGIRPPRRRPPIFAKLTEEQRAELREMVKRMREEGAPPEDIRSAVRAKLREWGVVPPEPSAKPAAPAAQQATWGQVKSQFK